MNQQTIDMLTEMKMTAMAAEFANQIQDASFNSLGFEERLSMLVTAEWNRRLPASTLMKAITLCWKAPPVMARLTSPAR